jgi:AbrB family looped-hinge helix DNA binding protein
MTTATVGQRFQVVIPRPERDKIGLKPHDEVAVEARDGYVLIQPVRGARLRGIGRDLADGNDATAYVRRLRAEWTQRR